MYVHVIGLMSGTSLDGLDIVYVKFYKNNPQKFEILASETISYNQQWKTDLKNAFTYSADKLAYLDVLFGKYLGEQVNLFIDKHKINKTEIDLIASHGQTIFHKPELGYTTQIGNGAHIASITQIKTICDFRTQDVALGGQGAPLVPIGDQMLFSDYDYCLNLGGFANISFDEHKKRIAYDVCPANIVLNHYTNKLGYEYDDKGEIAASGKLNTKLFDDLNTIKFYKSKKPKSLGWEFVVENIIPLIDKHNIDVPSLLNTYVEHIVIQVIHKTKNRGNMLVTGGGAHNKYLMQRFKKLSKLNIVVPEKQIIDYKEALIFGLLGYLKNFNKVNILSSVTGSTTNHSAGIIYNIY